MRDDAAQKPVQAGNVFRQYRAPRRHGESLVEPDLSQAASLLQANRDLQSTYGPFFDRLRERARRQLIEDAIRYTSAYRNVDWVDPAADRPIIMAGHQPALFHPGVWFKNFALSHLAERHGATAVNLVVDNDVASGCSIRVPTVDPIREETRYEVVAYDEAGGGVPYEQTTIRERAIFDSFAQRVHQAIAPIVDDPCVDQLWQHARAAIARCGVAGCALAQARHGLEGDLGLRTLELPLGVACRTTAFAEFVLSILTELPRFHRCYNDAADSYRQVHGIRSSAHPVPNLAEDSDWFEAPLWIYGNNSPQRRPAWVRLSDDQLVLSDRGSRELKVDIRHPKLAAEQLASLVSPDFKLRPRALLTTMYARLVLSDLFLHGIGGGKYDQLGDLITQAFFGLQPPQFMVISATVQLPGLELTNHDQRIRQLQRALRDTEYQPERFADRVSLEPELLRRKAELLANLPAAGEKKAWQDQIAAVNAAMSSALESEREELRAELATVNRQAAAQNLLASREHSFCLFPLDYLTSTFEKLLQEVV